MCTPSHVTCNMSNSILSCNNMVGKYLQIEIDSKMVNDLVKDIELAGQNRNLTQGSRLQVQSFLLHHSGIKNTAPASLLQ